MPQLVLLILIAAVAYYGYRSFVREAERVTRKAERARQEVKNQSIGTLVKDPKTGEYRPARD